MPASLAPGEVALWIALVADVDEPGAAARSLELLSPDERVRHDRFRHPARRRGFVEARVLLRRALSHHFEAIEADPAGWRFRVDRHGRPELDGGAATASIRFNLSHTEGLVACALAVGARVGVDVESSARRLDVAKLARRCCGPGEIADLQSRADPREQRQRFLAYWTLKEAYLKAVGTGLRTSARSAEFALRGAADAGLVSEPAAGGPWHLFRLQPSPRHQLAVAVAGRERPRLRVSESSL